MHAPATGPSRTSPTAPWVPVVLLVALTVFAFRSVWRHEFVAYDDPEYVTANRVVQSGLTWSGAQWAFTTFHASNWHPLTWLSHQLDAGWFGPNPAGPHAVNLALHVAATLVLFAALQRLTGARWRSAFVAALFALHPLRVESVAWVAQRKDGLSGFFFAATLLAYARYAQTPPDARGPRRAAYVAALALFAGGLMSKPTLVTLPCVLVLLDYWPLRRLTARTVVREKIPFFALSAAAGVLTFLAQRHGGAVRTLEAFPLHDRVANAVVAYARYLEKTFRPADLAFFHPHPGTWPFAIVAGAALLVALLTVAAWLGRRRWPFVLVGGLWFGGMLVPMAGLVQVGGQAIAERYTYLPLIGGFVALTWSAGELLQRIRVPRLVTATAAAMLLAACVVRTDAQARVWRNSETLFRHALAVTAENHVAHNNLGHVLLDRGALDDAAAHFAAALAIRPDYADARNNLGHVRLQQGRVEDALAAFRAVLAIDPRDADAHNNLANALLQTGHTDGAITHYRITLDLRPDHARAHNNLGWVLFTRGQTDESLHHLQTAVALAPDYANAHRNLGDVLLQIGRTTEAAAHFESASHPLAHERRRLP